MCKEDQAMEEAEACSKCFAEKQGMWHITYHIWTENCPFKFNIALKCNCRRPVSCAFCFSVLVALFLQHVDACIMFLVHFGPFPLVGISRERINVEVRNLPGDHLGPFCFRFQLSSRWFVILHLARSFYIRILGQARECAAGPTEAKNQHPKMPAMKNPRKTSTKVEKTYIIYNM